MNDIRALEDETKAELDRVSFLTDHKLAYFVELRSIVSLQQK